MDHIRADCWIDPTRLNSIYRYETDQFGDKIANKYNIHVPSIPRWVYQWIQENPGYFLGNIGPGLGDVIGPSGNYSSINDTAKGLLSAAMLIGRLELMAVYVMLTLKFWRA